MFLKIRTGKFLRPFLQAHREAAAHFNATGPPSQLNVPIQTRGMLHGPEEQSQTRGGQGIGVTDQPEYPRL